MYDLLINVLGTIIGGLIFTLFLFLLNEYIFPKNNLTGEWTTSIKIEKTSYNPFKNLTIEYKIHLMQKGYELSGSGEKIKDINVDGSSTIFQRQKRVNIEIDGFFERKYFGKSKVFLIIEEKGRKRDTRATYILTLTNHETLEGTFISTAADASGTIMMKRQC